MKILLVHNFYGSGAPSGENLVFEAEKRMLQSRGHEVFELIRESDEIRAQGPWGMIKGAMATPWNPWMHHAVARTIHRLSPSIVHVHNTFPLISPAVFHAVGTRSARVLTLHNYRLFCPAAIPMRDGRTCTECIDSKSVLPAIRHACYRESRLATAPVALGVAIHRALGTWENEVDAFIALTAFQKERMHAAGLPATKLHVKPNFFPGSPTPVWWADRGNYAVYVGRLTPEKGVGTLITAWVEAAKARKQPPELRIVGDGPLRASLEQQARGLPIRFLGALPAAEAQAEVARTRLLVLPSECFEGFPMVVREAFAFGTPIAASDLGPLPGIVRSGTNGFTFAPRDPKSLWAAVEHAWNCPGLLEQLGAGAREEFDVHYNEDVNYARLMKIYESALSAQRP